MRGGESAAAVRTTLGACARANGVGTTDGPISRTTGRKEGGGQAGEIVHLGVCPQSRRAAAVTQYELSAHL